MNKINTVIFSKQCKQYHESVAKGDAYAAHLFYLPPVYKTLEQIQSEIRFKNIVDNFKAETKRVNETDSELLRIETELRLGYKKEPKKTGKRINFFGWLFGKKKK